MIDEVFSFAWMIEQSDHTQNKARSITVRVKTHWNVDNVFNPAVFKPVRV